MRSDVFFFGGNGARMGISRHAIAYATDIDGDTTVFLMGQDISNVPMTNQLGVKYDQGVVRAINFKIPPQFVERFWKWYVGSDAVE